MHLASLWSHLAAVHPPHRRRRGMGLLEIMIVIAIIMLLTASLMVGLRSMWGESMRSTAELTLIKVGRQVELYEARRRQLPPDLEAVFRFEPLPVDPWGNALVYEPDGERGFDVLSYAADGAPGGTGADEDLRLSDLQ
jgi:general secretion pathway protein G